MGFRHTFLTRFTNDATDEQQQALLDGLSRLPDRIAGIRHHEFGPDLRLTDGSLDAALVAEFDSEADWREYTAHPAHVELVDELVRPMTDAAFRLQCEIE